MYASWVKGRVPNGCRSQNAVTNFWYGHHDLDLLHVSQVLEECASADATVDGSFKTAEASMYPPKPFGIVRRLNRVRDTGIVQIVEYLRCESNLV